MTIDLTGIASNTQAMLYFDLLSFSSGASQVSIDNIKIFATIQLAPQLQNANLATNQATGLNIPLPSAGLIHPPEKNRSNPFLSLSLDRM